MTRSPVSRGPLSGTELAAWRGFLRSHAALVGALDAELEGQHGLPLSSYEVLARLERAPERRMRMSELADSVLLTLSGVTRLVDRLEREGLVERVRCASDGRGLYAALTPRGRERLREARPTHHAGIRRRFLAHFSESELEELAVYWSRLEGERDAHGALGLRGSR